MSHTPEQQPHSPPPELTEELSSDESPPPSPLIIGPKYKPLTQTELILPVDFALPILEDHLKKQIDIDDPEPIPDLSKIRIIPLKRKKPEPTISFDPTKPFFNSLSEPNLELLDIAISLSLKRLKRMDEEVLVFPSDIDAEIREMEHRFSQCLQILGNHLKSNIQGRGVAAVRELFSIAESQNAPRLTFYNHEEELQRLEALAAEHKRLSTLTTRIACEAAERLIEEESRYARLVMDAEQARIAAEIEHKRMAAQEALKLLVDRAVQIAEIETNIIQQN
jgi:hypothetical protein